MKRGQTAIEFVVLCTMMFLMTTVSIIYIQSLLVDISGDGIDSGMNGVLDLVEGETSRAAQQPIDYYRTFDLPDSIQGLPYTIGIQEENAPLKDSLIITTGERTITRFIFQDVSGTLHSGSNTLVSNASGIYLN